MNIPEPVLLDILLKNNFLSKEDAEKAIKENNQNSLSIIEYLLSKNLITKDLLGQAISESFSLP